MNKFLRLGCSLLMGVSFFFLAACDDDNTTRNDPEPELSGKVFYQFSSPGSEILKIIDVRVTYAAALGKDTTVSILSVPWEETIDIKAPFIAKIKVSFSKKENLKLTQEKYAINIDTGIGYTLSSGISNSFNVDGTNYLERAKVENYINHLVQRNIEMTDTIR